MSWNEKPRATDRRTACAKSLWQLEELNRSQLGREEEDRSWRTRTELLQLCGWRGLQQPHPVSHVKMKKSHKEPLRVLGREETHLDLYSEMNTLAVLRASPRVTHVIIKNKLRSWCSGYHPLQEGRREYQRHLGSGRSNTKLAPDPKALFYAISLALIMEVKVMETRGNALGMTLI